MDNYTELRKAIEAAKRGWPENWAVGKSGRTGAKERCEVVNVSGEAEFGTWFICQTDWPDHADYIAAANPAVIKQLLADYERVKDALEAAIKVAGEAADEWDKAPQGMKAGKLLLALCGHLKGYRADITAIHEAARRGGAEIGEG